MAEITLRQLRYFSALAHHLHFGRAASECAVTQPALSMQILDLETKLGMVLAERTPQGVALTPEGMEVAARARRILSEIRDLGDYAGQRGDLLTGSMRFGVIPSIAPYVLPGLLPHLRRAYPDMQLQLRETLTRSLVAELLDGQLDLVLLALPVTEPGIETMDLFDDPFLLAVPQDYDASGPPSTIDEIIARDNLLLLEEGHCLRDQALNYCKLRKNDIVNTFGVSSISTIVQMVDNGYGVTLLPQMSVELETRHARIKLVRFAPPAPKRVIGLAWRASSPHKPDLIACARLIRASIHVGGEQPGERASS